RAEDVLCVAGRPSAVEVGLTFVLDAVVARRRLTLVQDPGVGAGGRAVEALAVPLPFGRAGAGLSGRALLALDPADRAAAVGVGLALVQDAVVAARRGARQRAGVAVQALAVG